MVGIAMMAFAVIAALAKFGIQTTSFIAVLGAAGLAVGLALQGSLSNFAAGVMILIFRPIRVGDLVEAGGYLGKIDEIGIFVTTMNTLDNQKIIIPNSVITGNVINNVNGNGMRRVDMTAGISYSDDMTKAKGILMEILEAHPKVLKDPEPTVAVKRAGGLLGELRRAPVGRGRRLLDGLVRRDPEHQGRFDAGRQDPVPAARRAPVPADGRFTGRLGGVRYS